MPTSLPREDTSGLPYRHGVRAMLVNLAGLVFVGPHVNSTLEAWQISQGGIDAGEEPLETALRKLMDKTGVLHHLVELIAETPDWHCCHPSNLMVGTT